MPLTQRELLTVVHRLATKDATRSEATVQSDVRELLLHGDLGLGPDDVVKLESPAGNRLRIDVEVGFCVIEVKKDLRVGNVAKEAVDQLAGYVRRRTDLLKQRYVGVLTDGSEWRLYWLDTSSSLVEVSRLEVRPLQPDPDTLLGWLSAILATNSDIRPTAPEIHSRLGASSPSHALDRATLTELWRTASQTPEGQIKRELWGQLLTTALGTNFRDEDDLFIEHTYLVITSELIAHALLGLSIETLPPTDLVTGTQFTDRAIYGVVEADFFDWPAGSPEGAAFIRDLARRIARFDWSREVEHDILKNLYQSVIDAEQRRRLGEYYTPDWLALAVVKECMHAPLRQRVLDPACGSGTFVFHAARRCIEAAEEAGEDNRQVLDRVARQVSGMDIHPVAVILARVTYLLALGRDRLSGDRGDVRVPVYLGDSAQWQINHSVLGHEGLTVQTDDDLALFASDLRFPPSVLSDVETFDQLVQTLTVRASRRPPGTKRPSIDRLLQPLGLIESDRKIIEETFGTLCDLHDHHRNHIWGYYLRNLARPLWLARDKVDCLIGNPPWLAYRSMPQAMQRVFREQCRHRGLWAGRNLAPQQDLSAYFLVRCVEMYLRGTGRFGFVMPLAALSRKAYSGFRTGDWGIAGTAELRAAWNLENVRPQPFPVPASVVFGDRDGRAALKSSEIWSGSIPEEGHHEDSAVVLARLSRTPADLAASGGVARSPYGARFFQGATVAPRVLYLVEEAPTVDALGLPSKVRRVRSVRSRLEKEPWKSLPTREGTVESQFVFPVHMGSTIAPFRPLKPVEAVFPWDGEELLDGDDAKLDDYERLAHWWRAGEAMWREHSSSAGKMSLRQRLDFFRGFTTQFPAPSERIVYSKAGSTAVAARVTDHRCVIDTTLYWAKAQSTQEARYITAVLNAPALTQLVEPMQSRGLFGPRHFDKYIWQLPIPAYKPGDERHSHLVDLAEEAEVVAARVELPSGVGFQPARRMLRAAFEKHGLSASLDSAVRVLLS